MVISLPISISVGAGGIVLVGEIVCVGVLNPWGKTGLMIVGKTIAVALIEVVDGVTVAVAIGVSPADWSVVILPSPATLQPAEISKKIIRRKITCRFTTIPINPLPELSKLP